MLILSKTIQQGCIFILGHANVCKKDTLRKRCPGIKTVPVIRKEKAVKKLDFLHGFYETTDYLTIL